MSEPLSIKEFIEGVKANQHKDWPPYWKRFADHAVVTFEFITKQNAELNAKLTATQALLEEAVVWLKRLYTDDHAPECTEINEDETECECGFLDVQTFLAKIREAKKEGV